MTEFDMQKECYYKLKKVDCYKEVLLEVPFLSRCIDMVIITQDNRVVSIEFKINQWRNAIKQAQDHKLGADESYICLPKRRVTDMLRRELIDNGIGLFLYNPELDNPLEMIIPARYSEARWQPIVKGFKKTINMIAERNVII